MRVLFSLLQMLSLCVLFLHSWPVACIYFGLGMEYIISVENAAVWYLLNNISSFFCCCPVFLSNVVFYSGMSFERWCLEKHWNETGCGLQGNTGEAYAHRHIKGTQKPYKLPTVAKYKEWIRGWGWGRKRKGQPGSAAPWGGPALTEVIRRSCHSNIWLTLTSGRNYTKGARGATFWTFFSSISWFISKQI